MFVVACFSSIFIRLSCQSNFEVSSRDNQIDGELIPSSQLIKNFGEKPIIKVARKTPSFQVWDIKISRENQRSFVKSLDSNGALNIWRDRRSRMDVMVEGNNAAQVQRLFKERGISFDVTVADVARVLAMERITTTPPPKPVTLQPVRRARTVSVSGRTMNWKDFHPLSVVYAYMDSLEGEYPSICTVSVIGKSVEGRDIKILKISNSCVSNEGIWMDGAIHSREWISTSVVTFIADYIARNFTSLPDNFTNKDWYFLPVMNPDGYAHTHVCDRMWRKNRARHDGQCFGVDLNRNFSHGWGGTGLDCTQMGPIHANYRGPEPFSEPETRAVRDIILASNTSFKVYLSFHSYSQVISFPWCFTSEPCPHYVRLLEGATAMAKAIYETNGSMYKVGSFKDVMYSASGTSIDWCYGTVQIPYSYLIELRSKKHRFLLPKEEIMDNCKEILNGLKALLNFLDTRG